MIKKLDILTASRICIIILLLIIIRTIGEYFRLKHLPAEKFDPYLAGAFATSIICLFSVILYFVERYLLVVIITVLTIISLIIYKIFYIQAF
jgi:hypothetical protein